LQTFGTLTEERAVIRHLSHPLALGLPFAVPPLALRPAAGATRAGFGRLVRPAGGDQAGRNHIGMRQVDFRGDHDVIRAAGRGRFRSIRIAVESGDLEMFNVTITFGDGENFSPATRLYFGAHSRSRQIDLPGGARVIRRIEFFYRSVRSGGGGRARVHVYGRR
jgi:hypothetical protein